MKINSVLKKASILEALMLLASVLIVVLRPEKASQFKLYELLGVFASTIVTTEGIRRINKIT
jgi:hypothetical protein